MHIIKKIIFTLLLACSIITIPATVNAAGKIENASLEEIIAAIDTTISNTEKTLDALEKGADEETILSLLSDTKQVAKEIHATRRAAVFKSKAGSQMKKARKETKKGDLAKAKDHVEEGLKLYKQLKQAFMETNG